MTNSYAIADTDQNALQSTLQWLALSLTPGIGGSRGRKLIELFDRVDRLFTASLTELKAADALPPPPKALPSVNHWNELRMSSTELKP